MSTASLPDDQILVRVAQLARRAAERNLDAGLIRSGRARFLQRVRDEGGARRSQRPWVVALTMLSAALVTVLAWFAWPTRVVEYSVAGALVTEGGFVQATAQDSARITFDDGTVVELEPAARVRVSQQRPHGASIFLEKGRLDVAVVPRDGGADYVFEAGPYRVMVVGTVFTLAWDPDRSVAVLSMKEGEVRVLGPRLESGLTVREGQRVELNLDEVRVSDEAAASLTPATSAGLDSERAAPGASPASTNAGSANPSVAPLASARSLSWAERVAVGDYEAVLDDVDARGESTVLASASVGDLMMLADAARYGARPALASSALRAVRTRFAGTKSAASAAFLLGRMAEDGGRAKEAVGLYEAAIAEGSPFSGEALGRTMTLAHKQKKASAKELAQRYLASHPKGAYADVARAILGSQGPMPKEI